MNRRTLTLAAAGAAIVAATACVPPQTSSVRYVKIDADFTVADCIAYPGGGVQGQGADAVCRIVP